MKKVLIAVLVIVVLFVALLIGLVAFGFSKMDDIFKTGIERGGTYATGVDTTVDTVEVELFKGTFAMSGFQLANPAGFETPHFLALNGTSVTVDTQSVSSDTIVLPTLTLEGIDVYLDKGGNPSNYQTILNSLQRFESGDKPAPPPEEEAGGFQFVIESLKIKDVNVHLANMPGVSLLAGDVAVTVPEIELQNVGSADPMSFSEIIGLVVKTVLAAAVESGGGIIPGDVLGDLTSGLGSLQSLQDMGIDAVGEIGKQIESQIGDVTEQVDKAVEDVQNKVDDAQKQVEDAAEDLKGIFGGKKKDEP